MSIVTTSRFAKVAIIAIKPAENLYQKSFNLQIHKKRVETTGTFTAVSAHEFNNSNSILHALHFHMCSIDSSLSFLNSSVKPKGFVNHLKQWMKKKIDV